MQRYELRTLTRKISPWPNPPHRAGGANIGSCVVNISGLHPHQFFFSFRTQQPFEYRYELAQFNRLIVGEIQKSEGSRKLRGRAVAYRESACDYVVDKGKVALEIAMVEHATGDILKNGLGKAKIGRVGSTSGSVDRKKAKSGGG